MQARAIAHYAETLAMLLVIWMCNAYAFWIMYRYLVLLRSTRCIGSKLTKVERHVQWGVVPSLLSSSRELLDHQQGSGLARGCKICSYRGLFSS